MIRSKTFITCCTSVLAAAFADLSELGAAPKTLIEGDTIVFYGDSISERGAVPGGAFALVDLAISELYPDKGVRVIEAGNSGDKITNLEERLDRNVLSQQPSIVEILNGIDGILTGLVWSNCRGDDSRMRFFDFGKVKNYLNILVEESNIETGDA